MIDLGKTFEVRIAVYDPGRHALRMVREYDPRPWLYNEARWGSVRYYVPLDHELVILIRRTKAEEGTAAGSSNQYHVKIDASGGDHKETRPLPADHWTIWTCNEDISRIADKDIIHVDCKGGMVANDAETTVTLELAGEPEDVDKRYVFEFWVQKQDRAYDMGHDVDQPDLDEEQAAIMLPLAAKDGCSKVPNIASLDVAEEAAWKEYIDETAMDGDAALPSSHGELKSKSAPSTPLKTKRAAEPAKAPLTEPSKRVRLDLKGNSFSPSPSAATRTSNTSSRSASAKFRPFCYTESATPKKAMVLEEKGKLRVIEASLKELREHDVKMRIAHHDAIQKLEADAERLIERRERNTANAEMKLEEEFGDGAAERLQEEQEALLSSFQEVDGRISYLKRLIEQRPPELISQAEQLIRCFEAIEVTESDDDMEPVENEDKCRQSVRDGDRKPAKKDDREEVQAVRVLLDRLQENEERMKEIRARLKEVTLNLKSLPDLLQERKDALEVQLENYAHNKRKDLQVKRDRQNAAYNKQKIGIQKRMADLVAQRKASEAYIAVLDSTSDVQGAVQDDDVEILSSGSEDELQDSSSENGAGADISAE